jgi:hypothetical protein
MFSKLLQNMKKSTLIRKVIICITVLLIPGLMGAQSPVGIFDIHAQPNPDIVFFQAAGDRH